MNKKTNKLSINTKKSLKKNQHYKIKNMSGGAVDPEMTTLKDNFEQLYNYGFKLTADPAGGAGADHILSWRLEDPIGAQEGEITQVQRKLEAAAIKAILIRETIENKQSIHELLIKLDPAGPD